MYMGILFLRLQIDLLEVAIVIAASVVLTLLFDLPMQEVKNVIMESTDIMLEASEEKKTHLSEDKNAEFIEKVKVAVEQTNVLENDEIASTGWAKDIAHGATLEGHDTKEEIVDVPTLKKMNGRRMFVDRNSEELAEKPSARKSSRDTESYTDHKTGMDSQRYVTDDSEEEAIEFFRSQRERDETVAQRNKRSLSRTKDNKRLSSRDSESEEEWQHRRKIEDESRQFKRSESRGRTLTKEADDYRSLDVVGKEDSSARQQHESKPSLVRSADIAKRTFSSESEEESSIQRRMKPVRVSSSEARTSDEEEWERELRIRRKQFMEKLITQQRESLIEGESELLKRRSSAEGRIALLRDDIENEDNMDSWTVSVGPQITFLGSTREPSEPEEDSVYTRRREYREQGPPSREESLSEEESSQDTSRRQSYTSGSQKTSLEEEDDVNNYNFILTKESKRESLQDLSQLSQEDLASAGWNVVKKEGDLSVKPASTGLFKRESIIKSQASEEDPEYLLPERPKLVQQEREHPFKKAWQMQKSRSEEEGSSAYTIKDSKEQQSETKAKEPPIKRERSGEQFEDIESFADDESVEVTMVLRGRSTDTEDARTSSTRSGTDETDSISTECSRATREGDYRQSSKSETDEDSAKFNWLGEEEEETAEDEIHETGRRGKSEEADWDWKREET